MARINPGVMQVSDGGGELDPKVLLDAVTKQQVAAGIKSTDPSARVGSETAAQANARIVQGYKDQAKPDLTVEGAAAGATIKFVRTGAGGVGEYKEIFPIGSPIPTTRTTTSGNVYDAQGNLVSGTGLKTITLKPGDPGYVAPKVPKFGDPGYVLKPGDPGYVAPNGNSNSIYDAKRAVGYGMDTAGNQYRGSGTTADLFTVNGNPFTGTWQGKAYKNGILDTTVIVNDPLGGNLENPAFSIVEGILKNYDMKGVADSIAKIRKDYPEIASADILALLKFDTRYNAPYLERFAGNAALIKKGLPTLSDEAYLNVEKEYENIFKSYDVGSLANRKMYATLIGNSMDAVDVTGRLQVGYTRLKADKYTEEAFRKFFPSLSDGDIVAAMLNPEEMLPALQRKATAAEIGGSYLAQGLETSKVSAESLAAFGINKVGAQAGVRYIAQALPRGRALSQIYGETGVNYTQQTAEDITFKKNVKAQEQEDILKAKEIGTFSATSGIMSSKSLASQTRAAGLI